jgi:hypothetical protein
LRVEPLLGGRHRAGRDDRLFENLVGRDQVFFQEDRLDREDVADVVEAVTHVVGGEVVGRLEVDAAQIADGVVVLARLSRRSVTRPGSFGAVQSTFVSALPIQSMTNSFSAVGGWAFFLGGISPVAITCLTVSQVARSFLAWASLTYTSRATPPACLSPLWQELQYLPRNGLIFCSNVGSAFAGSAAIGWRTANNPTASARVAGAKVRNVTRHMGIDAAPEAGGGAGGLSRQKSTTRPKTAAGRLN